MEVFCVPINFIHNFEKKNYIHVRKSRAYSTPLQMSDENQVLVHYFFFGTPGVPGFGTHTRKERFNVGVNNPGCLFMYSNEGRVETIEFSSFNSVILNKFNLYKCEG